MTLFLLAIVFRVFSIQYKEGEKYRKLSTELTIKQDTQTKEMFTLQMEICWLPLCLNLLLEWMLWQL